MRKIMALPRQKRIKKIDLTKSIKLDELPRSFWQAIAETVQTEVRDRLQRQVGANKVKFPKKKFPERAGSPLYLIDTGESTKFVVKYSKNKVTISPKRPEILKYHFKKAPLFALDDTFQAKISRKFQSKLKPFLSKTLKSRV